MTPESKKSYAIAIVLALVIAGSAAAYKYTAKDEITVSKDIPPVGKVGSDHAHASLLIMIGDRILNFCSPEYMLKSQYVHFEDDNCTVVHRHATGITIPTFLKTIGVIVNKDCLTVPADQKTYCDSGKNRLRAVVNGIEMPVESLPYYVFRNNDHILLNYGAEEGDMLRFKYNQVPQIPLEVNEPEADNPYGKILEEPKLENTK